MDQEHSLSFGGVGRNKTITESVLLENGPKFPLPLSRMQSLHASCEVGLLLQNLFLVIGKVLFILVCDKSYWDGHNDWTDQTLLSIIF